MIASESGYTVPYLAACFHKYLEQTPPELPPFKQPKQDTYLLVDGLWFGRYFVLMVYRQSKDLYLLHIEMVKKEWGWKIVEHLNKLKSIYRFTGIVSDGGTGVVSAIQEVYPHTPHQICLFHMYQDAIRGLGKRPKDHHLVELRALADHVWIIESREALRWWVNQVRQWLHTNLDYLQEKRKDTEGRSWFIHQGARKAITTLLKLPQTSFTFLKGHPTMPKTTNEIEAQFGHLGKRWLAHRGLRRERWILFLKWFVYFYNLEKMTSRKTKKARFTNTRS
jgi:hypothetical protein